MDTGIYEKPLISVVMCTYNARPYIEEAVYSIINQTYEHWELIISDDCSTDGTREWLQGLTDQRIKLYLQETNLGYVANKNFVHKQAKGDFITQLDNDDICPADRLEKQVTVALSNLEIKMVACGYHRIDNSGQIFQTMRGGGDRIIYRFEDPYPFWFPSILAHKAVFEKVGYFDDYFTGVYGDDLYWTVRANEFFPIYYIDEPLYSYRNNPNSITNVLSSKRKLIFAKVLAELLQQRQVAGSDWLEEKNFQKLKAYEQGLLNDKEFMAEQYRVWAAKAIDKSNYDQARALLAKAFRLYPFKLRNYTTLLYYLRRFKRVA